MTVTLTAGTATATAADVLSAPMDLDTGRYKSRALNRAEWLITESLPSLQYGQLVFLTKGRAAAEGIRDLYRDATEPVTLTITDVSHQGLTARQHTAVDTIEIAAERMQGAPWWTVTVPVVEVP